MLEKAPATTRWPGRCDLEWGTGRQGGHTDLAKASGSQSSKQSWTSRVLHLADTVSHCLGQLWMMWYYSMLIFRAAPQLLPSLLAMIKCRVTPQALGQLCCLEWKVCRVCSCDYYVWGENIAPNSKIGRLGSAGMWVDYDFTREVYSRAQLGRGQGESCSCHCHHCHWHHHTARFVGDCEDNVSFCRGKHLVVV